MLDNQVIVGENEAGRSAKVRKTLEKLLDSLQKSTLDIAELLHEVKSKQYYSQWGFNTFQEYVNQLDIKARKAQYLVRIVDVMEQVEVPRNTYEPLGIAKLREITSLEPNSTYYSEEKNETYPMKDIIVGLVTKAEEMPLSELKESVRGLKGLTGENELVWINLCLKRAARDETVRPALDLAKLNIGSVGRDDDGNAVDASDGSALEMICVEYLNDPANKPLEKAIE